MTGPTKCGRVFAFVSAVFLIAVFPLDASGQQDSPCSGRIAGFEFSGNDTSREEMLIKLSELAVGQRYTPGSLDQARQNLLDSGLFKEVAVNAPPACSDQALISIRVEEKYYHLVYPRLSRNGDGDVATGLRYRGSNLFGLDHSLIIGVSRKEYADGDETDSRIFGYRLPMTSIPYEFRLAARDEETRLSDTLLPVTELDRVVAFAVGRDWLSHSFEMPVLILANVELREKELQGSSPDVDVLPGTHNSLGIRLEYDDVHEERYRRFGKFLALDIHKGMSALHSDFNPLIVRAEWRYYQRLNERDNLNLRLIVSLADELVFNEPLYSIGGADTLRGLAGDSKKGNHLWQANIEYVAGLRRYPSLRLALFSDLGNVFSRHDEFSAEDWEMTLGAGLRWKIQSFVKTDLVVDYGYDPASGYSKVYAATSLPF